MSASTVRLFHWNLDEGMEKAEMLRAAGYDVLYEDYDLARIRELRLSPPDVVVIDLSRIPSRGRDMGMMFRYHKSTRHIPVVFLEGEPEKVARMRELLPDAVYGTWKKVRSVLKDALSRPPVEGAGHVSAFAAFAGTPLVKKLGIKEKYRLGLVNAPEEFGEIVGELPDGAVMRNGLDNRPDIIFWFIRSQQELQSDVDWIAKNIGRGGVWIIWPKKKPGTRTDLSQNAIRAIANEAGMSDYKVASIDDTWSGMRFSLRKGQAAITTGSI